MLLRSDGSCWTWPTISPMALATAPWSRSQLHRDPAPLQTVANDLGKCNVNFARRHGAARGQVTWRNAEPLSGFCRGTLKAPGPERLDGVHSTPGCPQCLAVPLLQIPSPEVPWKLGELDSFSWEEREIEATCFAKPRTARAWITLQPCAACQ